MNDMQPGQLIVPNGPEEPHPGQPVLPQPAPQPTGEPKPERPTEAPESTPPPSPAPEPDAAVAVPNVMLAQSTEPLLPQAETAYGDISWKSAEFVEHEKSANWYGALAAVGIIIATLIYFLTKDKISTGTVIIVLIGFGLFAARKPRTQDYRLNAYGIQVGSKVYGFHDFKAFSIAEEGAVISVVLTPLKRFMPALTIYVAPEVENQVVGFLSMFMPFEQHKMDAIDSLMRRIRF